MSEQANDGGPAFPQPFYDEKGHCIDGFGGMTLGDYFASKAMAARIPLADSTAMAWHDWDMLAGAAYAQADAMLKARAA